MATTTEERPDAAIDATPKRTARAPRKTAAATAKAPARAKSAKAKDATDKPAARRKAAAADPGPVATIRKAARRAGARVAAAPAEAAASTRRAATRATTSTRNAAHKVADKAREPAGIAVAAGAAGLVAGLAANFVRKAIVQAPTVVAGNWDDALKAEHQATLAIFDKLEATTEANTVRRATLLTQLKHALAKHALQEENIVYAALRDHGQKEPADKLNHEHGYVKQYLYDLTQIDRASPKWIATVREFHGMIRNHMADEEERIFPAMRAELSDDQNRQLTVAMNKEGLKIA